MTQFLHGSGAKVVLRVPGPAVDNGQQVDADLFSGIPGQERQSVKLITENGMFRIILQPQGFNGRMAAGLVGVSGYQRLADPEEDMRHTALRALAQAFVVNGPDVPPGCDPLPAIYTYFGQFIAHEVSRLDPVEDGVLNNLNTASFDLDTIFYPVGRFPAAPQDRAPLCQVFGVAALGNTAPDTTENLADLPRTVDGAPVMPDPRDDANPMLAQLHVAILQKYRAMVQAHGEADAYTRLKVLLHAVTIHDYLKEVVDDCVYNDVLATGRKLVKPLKDPPSHFLTPIEFAAGAFRFGHAMVRSSYRWSRTALKREAELPELLLHTHVGGGLDRGEGAGPWRLPFDWTMAAADMLQGAEHDTPNLASRIAPSLAAGLQKLNSTLVPHSNPVPPGINLAEKTLLRGQEVQLACAQSLWALIEVKCGQFLTEDEITGPPGSRFHDALTMNDNDKPTLAERTPLWFYVLREAEVLHGGRKLGPLGGRIVMETIHAAIAAAGSDPQSLPPAKLANLFDLTAA